MSPAVQGDLVVVPVRCPNCGGAVELECDPPRAYQGYQTYNEYICPYCHKHDVQRTSGAIQVARKAS
jgi:hypothetical protein